MTPEREREIRTSLYRGDPERDAIIDLLAALDTTRAERDAALARARTAEDAAADLLAEHAAEVERLTRDAAEARTMLDLSLRAWNATGGPHEGAVALIAENARLAAALEAWTARAIGLQDTCDDIRARSRPFLDFAEAHAPTNDGCSGFTNEVIGVPTKAQRTALRAALAATPTDLAAERDRRVRAGALRDAAARLPNTDPEAIWQWLRAEAERIERGGQ